MIRKAGVEWRGSGAVGAACSLREPELCSEAGSSFVARLEDRKAISPVFPGRRSALGSWAAAASGMLVMFYQAWVWRFGASEELRLQERLRERERIARELHDTLLQSTGGLILLLQAVCSDIPEDSSTRTKLDQALVRAGEVMAEGRDRVLDLRVPADSVRDLAGALAEIGEQLARDFTIRFSTAVEGRVRALEPAAKEQLYRIGREALLNAFHHAKAKVIEVRIIYSDEALRLRILDDGCGIAAETFKAGSRPGHWGLKGMRERADQIGAQFEIRTLPGAGTQIEVRLPAARAYRSRVTRLLRAPLLQTFGRRTRLPATSGLSELL